MVTLLGLWPCGSLRRVRAPDDRAAFVVISLVFSTVYFVLVERCMTRFRRVAAAVLLDLRPVLLVARALLEGACDQYLQIFNGTPFKNVIWRLLGVRIGKRVFDDGCYMTETTLVTIGDDCTLNAGSDDPVPLAGGRHLQVRPHHDRRRLHARRRRLRPLRRDDGRRRGARPRLLPDEGRGGPADARWGGNPAREMRGADRVHACSHDHDESRQRRSGQYPLTHARRCAEE